jgi:SepF-like predicted cell division protein (DUF552 family)
VILLDDEIKDIFKKLLEGQTRLDEKVSEIETEVRKRKNSIKLENIEKNINIIAEVQTKHKELNEKEYEKTGNIIIAKTSLIETVVTNTSKDVKEVKESMEVLKDMTGRHEVDINILKRRLV